MPRLAPFGLALAIALSLLAISRAAGAQNLPSPAEEPPSQPTVIKQAVGEEDPFVFTWLDTADGKLIFDDKVADQIHDLFANTVWLFLDNGTLIIGEKSGDKLEALFTPAMASNEKKTYFLFHLRTKNGLFLDGTVNVNSQDQSRAFAEMTLLILGDKGQSTTTHIEQILTIQ